MLSIPNAKQLPAFSGSRGPVRSQENQAQVLSLVSRHFPPQRLHSVLDDSKVGVIICDRRFRYKALNRSVAEIHNVPIEGLLGHSFHQTLGRLAEKVVPFWEKVFATGQPLTYFEIVGQLPKRSGAARWIEKVFPLRDSKGRITQAGGFVIEVPQTPLPNSPPSSSTHEAISAASNQSSRPHRRERAFLSQRELDVLRLLAAGKSSKEISSVLVISVRTVETYRARLVLKLDANSIVDLVRYAIRNRIVAL